MGRQSFQREQIESVQKPTGIDGGTGKRPPARSTDLAACFFERAGDA